MIKGRIHVLYEGSDMLPFYGHSLYALGLTVESCRGHLVVGHDGSFYGFKALMRYMAGLNWGIVMFVNAKKAFYILQILFHELMDDVLTVPQEDRTDWTAHWRKCYEDGEEEGKEKGPRALAARFTRAMSLVLRAACW